MKVEMGALAQGIEGPVFIDEIAFDTAGDKIYLYFNFRPEERLIRFDRELEDLPVGGI